jgi:anti-sigma-K factor RskA
MIGAARNAANRISAGARNWYGAPFRRRARAAGRAATGAWSFGRRGEPGTRRGGEHRVVAVRPHQAQLQQLVDHPFGGGAAHAAGLGQLLHGDPAAGRFDRVDDRVHRGLAHP